VYASIKLYNEFITKADEVRNYVSWESRAFFIEKYWFLFLELFSLYVSSSDFFPEKFLCRSHILS